MLRIALTFDDGYFKHYTYAKLLRTMNIRATFYVTTHIKEYMNHKLLGIKPELINEIANMGHEIGSHTCTHPNLVTVDKLKLIKELKESQKYLEDITGREVLGFAYPFGKYNNAVREFVKKFYMYGRSTELVGSGRELYNAPPKSLYELGAVPIFSIRKLYLLKFIRNCYMHKETAKPIIYTHLQSILKILVLITTLKSFDFNFVTVRELIGG